MRTNIRCTKKLIFKHALKFFMIIKVRIIIAGLAAIFMALIMLVHNL